MSANSAPTIVNSVLAGNVAEDGGAVYSSFSAVDIINCTIVGNAADAFGGGVLAWQSTTRLSNSVLWDNAADTGSGPQLALANNSHVTAWNCDILGGQASLYRESGCTLTWNAANVDISPRFVVPGYWASGLWVGGNYALRDVSPCIDAGDNEEIVGYDIDVAGNPRVYNNVAVDIGAYEFQGVQFVPDATPITIDSLTALTGAEAGYGVIMATGSDLGTAPAIADDAETIYLRIGPYSQSIDIARDGVTLVGSQYFYLGVSDSGSTLLLRIDLAAGTFSVTAQNVFLMGLTAPVPVEVAIGDYHRGLGSADESVITGLLPMAFVSGEADVIRVDSAVVLPGVLAVRGGIAAVVSDVDLNAPDITVSTHWGDSFSATFPGVGEDFIQIGSTYIYIRNATLNPDGLVSVAIIDLARCTFSITAQALGLDAQSTGTVEFGLAFGAFDQTDDFEF